MSAKGSITTSDYLPFEDFQHLLDELEKEEKYGWAAYTLASFCLALRIGDVLSLSWGNIIEKLGVVVTEKKTLKTKYIPIGQKTSERLSLLYNKIGRPPLDTPILLNRYGKCMSRQFVNRELKKWVGKYNLHIDHFSSHTFRKTFGRYVWDKRGRTQEALLLLNRIFRHGSVQTTMIYLGIRDDEISEIFGSIDV